MIIGVPRETVAGETRVALVPESVVKLKKAGYDILVEKDAGSASGFADAQYVADGARIGTAEEVYSQSDVILKVQKPGEHPSGKHELELMKKGALYIGFFFPLSFPELARKAADMGINIIAMDAVPRITKAQRMDVLSSQTNLGGYKAVIIAAQNLKKIFPLMMTAAGTISPARVVILGAGVAGLQAIATARRLGAVVEVSDIRPAVKEQVQSLGAKYIDPPEIEENAEDSGGYAKEASAEFIKRQQEILTEHLAEADVVITTAQVPGKKAPLLVTADMVKRMRPGSILVDMAAEQGGNCELTRANETVDVNGVQIMGVVNLPAQVPFHASQLYSRNVLALIEYFTKEAQLNFPEDDEIVQGAFIVRDGKIIHEKTRELAEA